MANVEFENEGLNMNVGNQPDRRSTMVKIVMNWGLAKNEKTANYILIGTITGSILLAIFITFNTFNSNPAVPQATPESILKMNIGPQK